MFLLILSAKAASTPGSQTEVCLGNLLLTETRVIQSPHIQAPYPKWNIGYRPVFGNTGFQSWFFEERFYYLFLHNFGDLGPHNRAEPVQASSGCLLLARRGKEQVYVRQASRIGTWTYKCEKCLIRNHKAKAKLTFCIKTIQMFITMYIHSPVV